MNDDTEAHPGLAVEDHSKDVEAAREAIGAAIKIAGPTMDVCDLIGAIVALVASQSNYPQAQGVDLAFRLIHEAAFIVGNDEASRILSRIIEARKSKKPKALA